MLRAKVCTRTATVHACSCTRADHKCMHAVRIHSRHNPQLRTNTCTLRTVPIHALQLRHAASNPQTESNPQAQQGYAAWRRGRCRRGVAWRGAARRGRAAWWRDQSHASTVYTGGDTDFACLGALACSVNQSTQLPTYCSCTNTCTNAPKRLRHISRRRFPDTSSQLGIPRNACICLMPAASCKAVPWTMDIYITARRTAGGCTRVK